MNAEYTAVNTVAREADIVCSRVVGEALSDAHLELRSRI